jgi:hypothetical protein
VVLLKENHKEPIEAATLDRKSGKAERLSEMSRARVEFGCGKDVDAVHLENAMRFPLSPNASAAEESGLHRGQASGLG